MSIQTARELPSELVKRDRKLPTELSEQLSCLEPQLVHGIRIGKFLSMLKGQNSTVNGER